MKLIITHLQGSKANTNAEFTDQKIMVGRDPIQCKLCFGEADAGVSRCHAEILVHEGMLVLRDLNSSFGTFVNTHRITQPVQLIVGTVVQFGQGGPMIRIDYFDPTVVVMRSADPVSANFQAKQTLGDVTPPSAGVQTPLVHSAQPAPPDYSTPVFPKSARPADFTPQPPTTPQAPVIPVSAPVAPVSSPSLAPQSGPPSLPPGNGGMTAGGIPFLELLNGQHPQQYKVTGTTSIGREDNNQVHLDPNIFPTVSRRHAEIKVENGQFILYDLGSFNGTLLDGQRIAAPMPLKNGNRIQMGFGGPEFRFVNHQQAVQAPVSGGKDQPGTMVVQSMKSSVKTGEGRQFVAHKEFTRDVLTLGRTPDNDLQLDVLQISKHHAQFVRMGNTIGVEDRGSTNGVYVNGQRVTKCAIRPNDLVQVGPYVLQVDPAGVTVFDSRSKSRIDVLDLTKEVKNRDGSGMIKLLDRVRLSIPANEFVGLLGPSGAGKSTLMDALNGMRPADQGAVLINTLNLYENINSFKQSIGYVPQDDIIHRELTVYRTLYYVAKMRLSSDTSNQEIDQIINEVMDVTGLASRRNVPISQLSGGQRKRVSIAVELITKPSIIFLDEPTSGLDPGTEEKIMHLFKQISEAGHSVILTTHAMENVRLFDKIVVMMRGRLVWYGPPQEALEYFNISSIKNLFDTLGDPNSDQIAIGWQRKFEQSQAYHRYVMQPLSGLQRMTTPQIRKATNDNTIGQSIRQTFVLARRYFEVMAGDKFNLTILLGQAPVIAMLMGLAVGKDWMRDFPYFILALSSIWFGCSNAAREIVKESSVYKRERMVNLGIFPYIFSKLIILTMIGVLQVALLYGLGAVFENVPGNPVLIYVNLLLSSLVGIGIGLLISAAVRTSEVATSLVPLILIPQILFGGLLLPNQGISEGIGLIMPAMWSYDSMKHISLLNSDMKIMRGQDEDDVDGELGRIKKANSKAIDKFKAQLEDYKAEQQQRLDEYRRRAESAQRGEGPPPGPMPELGPVPEAPEIEYPPENKSHFIGFTTTYGSIPLNFIVLGFFFFVLIGLTAFILRSKDVL
ncbi:MAG: FHA domain-containing protein [Blastocatellia bacterium]|nr:FHA domain-containing protein [Blastocatellia bacterium]